MKIGIIIGSIRDSRAGSAFADWIMAAASERQAADYELIDLKRFDVPLLTSPTVPAAANKQYENQNVQKWSAAIDACDGFVFVTPEYNHGVPGGFKNAFDSIGNEWQYKTVGFASYGAESGVRAVESWRQIVSNFSMHDVRQQVSVSRFIEFSADGTEFKPNERRAGELTTLFDQLEAATKAVSSLRHG